MSATSKPVFTKSVKLAADTGKHVFVEIDGSLPSANGSALGTTERAGKKDEQVSVLVLGQGIAVASGAIAKGALLRVAANGKVTTHSGSHTAVGRALTAAASADDEIEYIAIPN